MPCSGGKVKALHKGDEQVMRHQEPVTSCPFCKRLSLLKGLLYFCPYLFCDDTVGELMVCFLHALFNMSVYYACVAAGHCWHAWFPTYSFDHSWNTWRLYREDLQHFSLVWSDLLQAYGQRKTSLTVNAEGCSFSEWIHQPKSCVWLLHTRQNSYTLFIAKYSIWFDLIWFGRAGKLRSGFLKA